jgi:hypothetical protein
MGARLGLSPGVGQGLNLAITAVVLGGTAYQAVELNAPY